MEQSIWIDGIFIPESEAKIHCLTHTLHYGVGVFEGLRAYSTNKGPAIFRLKEHTERLYRSAAILGMTIPYSDKILNDTQCDLIRMNGLTSAYIRPLVFYGSESLGVQPNNLSIHVMIATTQWKSTLGLPCSPGDGVHVHTASYTRTLMNNNLYKAKATGNYIQSALALQEASSLGYDRALLLDSNGLIAEGSAENIFIIKNNTLYTPNSAAILEGITRDTIITLAQDEGFSVQVQSLTRENIYEADESFFTGTGAEIMPVLTLDRKPIGNGKVGNITQHLRQMYFETVSGKNKKHMEWLTKV